MANVLTLVTGVTGNSGPNAVGESAEETWQLVGTNDTPNVVVSSSRLRMINSYHTSAGLPTPTNITFPTGYTAFPAPSFTIVCGNVPTFPIFIFLRGLWR